MLPMAQVSTKTKKSTETEKEEERQLRSLSSALKRQGVEVRRESLTRGHAFNVKSGGCVFSDQPHIFVDRRLPVSQQVGILVDFVLEKKLVLTDEEMSRLSSSTKSLLQSSR
jgi:hypothetical protein